MKQLIRIDPPVKMTRALMREEIPLWGGGYPQEEDDHTGVPPTGYDYVPIESTPPYDEPTEKLEAKALTEAVGYNVVAKTDEEQTAYINNLAEQRESEQLTQARSRAASKELTAMSAEATAMTDQAALDNPTMFPAYCVGYAYEIGERLWYPLTSELFRVIQAHTSQLDWAPPALPAIYELVQVLEPSDVCDVAPVWDTNLWGTYIVGTKVLNGGSAWECTSLGQQYHEPSGPNGHWSWTKIKDCP